MEKEIKRAAEQGFARINPGSKMPDKKDKFIVKYGTYQAGKWAHLEKAFFRFVIGAEHRYVGDGRCELWINDQLVLYSQWNVSRYKQDGWYGNETILCHNCPRKYYKQILDLMRQRWYCPKQAREFHEIGYWKTSLPVR